MSRQKKRLVGMLLAALAVLLAAFFGHQWWQAGQRRDQAIAAMPRRPSLASARPALVARISQAEDDVKHSSDPVSALKDLSRLYHANGYTEPAVRIYDVLARLEPREPRWPHLKATLLSGYGQLEEAVPLLRRVLELDPHYWPARIRLADALLKLNRVDDAVAAYQAVLAADPQNAYALLGLARGRMEAKQLAQAEESLDRAVRAHPDFSAAWQMLAGLADQRGDPAAAASARIEAAKGKAFKDVPDPWADELLEDCYDPYKLRVAAASLENAGNTAGARRQLEHALRLAPDDATAHRELGRLFLQQKDLAAARPHLEKAVEMAPDDSENWIGVFKLATESHDPAAASRAVLAGLSHCPASPTLRLEHGRQLLAQKKFHEALAEFEEARRLRPNEPDPIVEVALTYLYLGDIPKAMAHMREVLGVQPEHPMALLALTRNAIESSSEADARQWFERVRRQPRSRPQDIQELAQMFTQRFGRNP